MTDLKKTLTKGTLGTVAAGAMALATATPAVAKDRDGIGAEEVIAGALIIGGIAAAAGAFDGDDRHDRYRDKHYRDKRYHDRHYDRGNWNHRGNWDRGWRGINPRQAVNRCSRVAERQARRFGGYRNARVLRIRDVDRTRYGYRVVGRKEVQGLRGHGYGYGNQGYDRGKFVCYFNGGRPQIDFRGIRGL